MKNKKVLIGVVAGVVAVLVIAAAAVAFFMLPKNDLVGKYETETAGVKQGLNIDNSKMTITSEGEIAGKKLKIAIKVDYKIVEQNGKSFVLEGSNPSVEVEGDGFSAEEKSKLNDSFKDELNKDNKLRLKLSDDKKKLTQVDKDGAEKVTYERK